MTSLKPISTLYVSYSNGNDRHTGIAPTPNAGENGPLQTIERAIALIRAQRQAENQQPITISLVDDYFTHSPIQLTDLQGVVLTSHGERKRIIGGVRIEGWRSGEFNGKACLCAPVPQGTKADFTDFYVNGERASVTRYPSEGGLKLIDAEHALRGKHISSEHMDASSKWVAVDPTDLASLDCIEDAIIHYQHFWIDEHSPIESYDRTSGKLVMEYNSRFAISVTYEENPNAAPLYHLTNVPNCFEKAGQWYLDRKTRTVYYIPTDPSISPDRIEAFAPITDKLLLISGEDVRICNLELTCTRGDYASTAIYSYKMPTDAKTFASDIQSVCSAPGAITLQAANRCGIYDCLLHGVGVHGIEILGESHHVRIESNRIYDVCAGGIRIAGGAVNEESPLSVSDCVIRRNEIFDCGKRYLAGCGILLMHAHHCEITENEIHDLEYSGISAGWVWGYRESATYGILIEGNHIYNVGKGNLSDLGGIYLLGRQPGTVVSENRIHDVRCYSYGAWGIYLDEGSSYVSVENNVVWRTERESFHLHYGKSNTVRGNLFLGGKSSCIRIGKKEEHDQLLLEGNVMVVDDAPIYGTLASPHKMITRKNALWNTSGTPLLLWRDADGTPYDLEKWQSLLGHDLDSTVTAPDVGEIDL